ncbi:MAG TPA: adventurous gliding motility TPR repeat lipoprotein GltE [Anaeromyxobacteraceae bacterium]|nr:adventurous gliding motility TPR repeat lipoprotein GltE [Anaeromyxobacteraceae bacterium]
MTTTTIQRASPALLLLAAACAASTPAPGDRSVEERPAASRSAAARSAEERPAEAGGARATRKHAEPTEEPSPLDTLPAKASRLFKEALKTLDDQKALKVPIDWPLMERKWRAVLDAADVAEARFNLGVALDAQGRTADAKAEYERALALKPSLRQARVNLGVQAERRGDVRASSAVYGEVLRDFPEDAMARERLAAIYRENGQGDDAWRLAREALLRDPRSTGAYKTMVRVAIQRKDYDVAKLIALRAQKLDDRDPDLALLLGEVLDQQGDEAAAAAQWKKTLELAPGNLPARYALLEQAVRKEAWPLVSEHAKAILAEDPKNAPVTLLRGIALRHSDKADEAASAYDKAEQLSGGSLPEVFLARGVLLMREKSECEPALVQFDRYTKAAGPILPKGSPVPALQRECDELIAANKAAAEAARQMQLDAEKAAAAEAAKKAAEAAKQEEEAAKKKAEDAAKQQAAEAAKKDAPAGEQKSPEVGDKPTPPAAKKAPTRRRK